MRKIAFALACLPVTCDGHGHGARTSMERVQRPAARAQKSLHSARTDPVLGLLSPSRRPKSTFGKLLLKQSDGLVERKPKETFGQLLLSLNPTSASIAAKPSDPRARPYARAPTSGSSRYMASSRHQASGRSASPTAGQRLSGSDKRKRSGQRIPGKRPSDLPPPRADSSSKMRGSAFSKMFNTKVLGTVITLVCGLAFWLVSNRSAKDAQVKRISKKAQKIAKHKDKANAKGQRPVQRQTRIATEASTQEAQLAPKSAPEVQPTPKPRQEVEVSENIKEEQAKKNVSRLPAKKAKKKVRKTEDKQNAVDNAVEEQADGVQQVESSDVVADQQITKLEKEEKEEDLIVEEVDDLQPRDLSSGAAEDQTDMEPAAVQCGQVRADDNGSSCMRVDGAVLSPDSTVASSGESASENESVVAGADEDSDQVRTEYIKNDEVGSLEHQTTTASAACHQEESSQQLTASSPSSSAAYTEMSATESDKQDDEDAHESVSVQGSPPSSAEVEVPSISQPASLEAVEAEPIVDVKSSADEQHVQHPVADTTNGEELELDSNDAILPPGVSLTSGTTFTDGRTVFTPCVSQDGQQWFTDGKQLYSAMYVPVPLDMNGAAMPSPSHAGSAYQNPCWNPSWDPAWQPHAGW